MCTNSKHTLRVFLLTYCVAVLTGRITGPARPSVRPSVPYWLRTGERNGVEKPKVIWTFLTAGVTGVHIFPNKRSKVLVKVAQYSALPGGRPHNMSAMGWHIFLVVESNWNKCIAIN